jgi:hypothetical protein
MAASASLIPQIRMQTGGRPDELIAYPLPYAALDARSKTEGQCKVIPEKLNM